MKFRQYLLGSCLPLVAITASIPALAQVDITDARTTGISTSTAGTGGTPSDVTVTSTGSVAVETGTAVTLDSDNDLTNAGRITSVDADNTTGALISGGNTGNFTNSGTIALTVTAATDALDPANPIVAGTGRTGILISGASPFVGNIENTAVSAVTIQGQESAGIRLETNAAVTGNILQTGSLSVFGENSFGLDIAGDVIGNLALNGPVSAVGENSVAVSVTGDVSGSVTIASPITSTAYVAANGTPITTRPFVTTRTALIDTGVIRQVGSSVNIGGNVGEGVLLARTVNADGVVTGLGSITMRGSAPAVLIDGNGTPIAIGRIAQITDPDDPDFDAELQYAFVNQGSLSADAVLDDLDATAFSVSDASLEGGINNSGSMISAVYRSGVDPAATAPTNDAHARVIIIGGGAIADRINNTGSIVATGSDAADAIYADPSNILAANRILATAIEIDAGGSLSSITNTGSISALITGRDGEAVAIRDSSGTLIQLTNQGNIGAFGGNSDPTGEATTSFNLIALDASANTSGFTLDQTGFTNPDTDVTTVPAIVGDVLLGSGDDTINIGAGSLVGDIAFGAGVDVLNITNGSGVAGAITDADGQLEILVADSTLTITGSDQIDVTNANFDATSTYSPFIDPTTEQVSLLNASGAVTFADGAIIAPRLANVLSGTEQSASFEIVSAGTLSIDETLSSLRSPASPFLYNTLITRDPADANTLVLTVDLRSTDELGLDGQQAAAFNSAFEALQNSTPLGAAFTQITEQAAFNSAYNQLLPEFAAAARQFVMANVDGATGAVGSHLGTARRSTDRPGGAWIQEFAYYADRELAGLSEQFRGYGFGITGGFDTEWGPFHTVGLNLGFATTEIEDVLGIDEPLDVLTLQGGLYAGYKTGNLGIDLYAGGGYNDFESSRNVEIGTFDETAQADWSGTHYNASATAGYDITFGKYFIRPSATVSYLNLNEKAYTESGSVDVALALDSRSVDVGTATGIIDIGARFDRDKYWIAPALRVGYRNDFINDGVVTTGRFVNGTNMFDITSQEFPSTGIVLGVTFAAGSKYSSFSFDLDSDIRDGFSRHTARLVLRMLF